MKKILYVTREPFPSFRVDIKVLFGKYLPRLDIYTSILSYKDPDALSTDHWAGLKPIIYRRKKSRILTPIYGLLEILLILKHIKNYDIIQVRDKPFIGLFSLVVAKLYRKKFVFWMSFPFPDEDIQKARLRKINAIKKILLLLRGFVTGFVQYRILMKVAPHIVVQSDEMKRWLNKTKHIPAEKMFPVPMGIDMEDILDIPENTKNQLRKKLGLENKIVLCYAGQISEVRGMDIMFNVAKRILTERDDIHILLIGDAPGNYEKLYLRKLLDTPELKGKITCTGWIPQDEVKKYLSVCDIGLSIILDNVIYRMSSPTKVMEYAAMGIPSIVNEIPDQKYVVNNTGGGIVVHYNEESVYNAINELINNKNLRKEYGERGRLNIGSLRGYDKIAARLARYYSNILNK